MTGMDWSNEDTWTGTEEGQQCPSVCNRSASCAQCKL